MIYYGNHDDESDITVEINNLNPSHSVFLSQNQVLFAAACNQASTAALTQLKDTLRTTLLVLQHGEATLQVYTELCDQP